MDLQQNERKTSMLNKLFIYHGPSGQIQAVSNLYFNKLKQNFYSI